MPRSPAIVSIGSPGTRRIRKNATSVIPMKVGMSRLTRVRMKRSMARTWLRRKIRCDKTHPKKKKGRSFSGPPLAALLVDVDPVKVVPAKGRELEIDDFLAHRLQLHGMRDGEPGRLLLEN